MIGAIIIVIVLVTLDIVTMLGSIRADREREQYWERKRGATMKKPESPCLGCADRSVGCHAPGACPAPYSYEQYCTDLERYRQFVRQAKADQHLSITDGMRFTRPKKKWVYKRGKD